MKITVIWSLSDILTAEYANKKSPCFSVNLENRGIFVYYGFNTTALSVRYFFISSIYNLPVLLRIVFFLTI